MCATLTFQEHCVSDNLKNTLSMLNYQARFCMCPTLNCQAHFVWDRETDSAMLNYHARLVYFLVLITRRIFVCAQR